MSDYMRGACAPNTPELTNTDLDVIEAGGFNALKMMDYHTVDQMREIRGETAVKTFVQRFPEFKQGDHWPEHAVKCAALVLRNADECRIYQTGNEPNQPEDVVGWGMKAWEYAAYMSAVMHMVKSRVEANGLHDVKYITPPLAWTPALWRYLGIWKSAFGTPPDHEGKIQSFAALHDYAGANCYWQYEKHLLDGSYGMSFGDVHNFTQLPPIVVEYGYSAYLLGLGPDRLRTDMVKQYPAYQQEVYKRGGVGSFVFLVGGTTDWQGLALPIEAARALGQQSIGPPSC